MELQAVAGQLHIVFGQAQSTSGIPGLLAQSAPSNAARGRERDYLFIHLTLSGQLEETSVMAQDLLDTISDRYYQSTGSVTAAMRKAINECNKLLLRHNLGDTDIVRDGALTCAVMRAEELFMAQTGEAFALLGHNFGIERLPAAPPQRITPLGRTAGLDIRYSHNWLQSGDMLLLADPRLAHIPTEAFESVLIDSFVEDGLEELGEIVGQDSARVILIEFTDEAPGHLPDIGKPARAATARQDLPPPTAPPLRESSDQPTETGAAPLTAALPRVDVETVETSARKATSKTALALSRVTGWTADLLGKIRPTGETEEDSSGWALPIFLAIAIPLIVGIVVTGVYLQRGRVARFAEIKSEIRNTLTLAQQAPSDAEAEQYYQDSLRLLAEADELRPGNVDVASMRQEVFIGLDAISGVARLQGSLLHQFDKDTDLISLSLGEGLEGDIFVLDGPNSRVYLIKSGENFRSPADIDPQIILSEEQVVGNHIVGRMQDLLWRPSGNHVARDGLTSLDKRGALISFFPNFSDTRAVPLALASEWDQPTSIATFNERLYILDPGTPTIWRYFAEGEGFTISEGQQTIEFVDDADLGHAVDLAIYSEDGSVILLYDDGRLRRYANGRLLWNEEGLASSGLENPMIAPTALKIVGRGLNSSIFVADPGSDRIIQFSLGGTFLAQYKASDVNGGELFSRTSDFAVVENPLRIVVSAGNDLYVASQE